MRRIVQPISARPSPNTDESMDGTRLPAFEIGTSSPGNATFTISTTSDR